jgi:hypothetical protein
MNGATFRHSLPYMYIQTLQINQNTARKQSQRTKAHHENKSNHSFPRDQKKRRKKQKEKNMPTTRLRRTFAYPTDSDSDNNDPPDLDEEHQEALLTTLQSQDETTSTLYRHLFLALPVLTSLAWLPTLFRASNATQTFVALLSVCVPALAAWVLYAYPIKGSGEEGPRSLHLSSGRGETPVRYWIVLGASLAAMLILQSGVLWWWAVEADVRATVPAGKFWFVSLIFYLLLSGTILCGSFSSY